MRILKAVRRAAQSMRAEARKTEGRT